MSLAVEVGMLAYLVANKEHEAADHLRLSIKRANEVLAESDLPPHHEPEELPPLLCRAALRSFPYSFLHHLRRVYAHWVQNPDDPATPCPEGEDAAADPIIDEEFSMLESHLLCHSDCEGYYLPIDFREIQVDDEGKNRIEGGMLGSSQQLRRELVDMAPCLGISLNDGQLTEQEVQKITNELESQGPLWIEKAVWLTLYEATRLSIEHRTMICFC